MVVVRRFHYPATVAEACQILSDIPQSAPIAGGTSLGFGGFGGKVELVDTSHLPLCEIRDEGGALAIGAGVTLQRLASSRAGKAFCGGVLRAAALSSAARHVRNRATVGGGLAASYPWSDLNVALLVLDARAVIQPEKKDVPLAAYFKAQPGKRLQRGQLITRVVIPKPDPRAEARFLKLSKTEGDISIGSAAAYMRVLANGTVKEARVAVGGAVPQPARLARVERALKGRKLKGEGVERAAKAAVEGLDLLSDIRVSKEYQRKVLAVLVRRAIMGDEGGDA